MARQSCRPCAICPCLSHHAIFSQGGCQSRPHHIRRGTQPEGRGTGFRGTLARASAAMSAAHALVPNSTTDNGAGATLPLLYIYIDSKRGFRGCRGSFFRKPLNYITIALTAGGW